MDSVLAQSVDRVIEEFCREESRYRAYLNGDKCSQANVSVLGDHWNACCRENNCSGNTLDRRNVICYLDKHVAHGDFVSDVLQAVNSEDALSREEFFLATYLLLMAVRKAQESLLMDQDEEELVGFDDQKQYGLTNVQKKLSHATSAGLSADAQEQDEEGWKIKSGSAPSLDLLSLEVEDTSGPLGQGVLSMKGASTVRHRGFADGPQDPWNAFDETKVSHSARSCSTWGRDVGQISLANAFKKLVGPLPGSTILPLTEEEKKQCLGSFKTKGYDQSGGFPIRDAIEMYHALDTRHVHFSKVWALVDPHTVCKIDERCFCAFIALVQSIANQGDAIKLPKTLSDTDISRLVLEPLPGQTSTHQLRLNLGKAFDPHDTCEDEMWSAALGEVETPRTCIESDYSYSDDESIGGASLVSRMPSIAGSFRSMSFNIKNIFRNASRIAGRDSDGKCLGERIGHLPSTRGVPAVSKLDSAVWREQSGPGHDYLEMMILSSALGTRREFDGPFVSIELRDKLGRLLELPLETAPGLQNRDRGTLKFSKQSKTLTSLLKNIPSGSSLFFAIKYWKAKKNKMSTIAWSVVDFEMICDVGNLSCRVREGKLALPLFQKPMDVSRQKAKRLNSRHPCLYIEVKGISQDSTD